MVAAFSPTQAHESLAPTATRPPIVPRTMGFAFDPEKISKHWLDGNAVMTNVANGLHLVFPEGERFFIRSVKHFMDRIEDPRLREDARNFFAQESRHGSEHSHSFEMLEAQGYDVKGFLDFYEKWVPRLEKLFPPQVNLSVTAALEHLTATMGENALTDPFLETFDEGMRVLLKWHAAEEIEHKSVAFDVLQKVAPSFPLRVLGMGLGVSTLMFFWYFGARHLMKQEGLSKVEWKAQRKVAKLRRGNHLRNLFRRAIVDYLKPGFHPDQNDNYHLARTYLASIGRLSA